MNIPGFYQNYLNTKGTYFLTQGPGNTFEGKFRAAINRSKPYPKYTGHGGYVNNSPCATGAHRRDDPFYQLNDAEKVNLKKKVHLLHRHLFERTDLALTGIINKDINIADFLNKRVNT